MSEENKPNTPVTKPADENKAADLTKETLLDTEATNLDLPQEDELVTLKRRAEQIGLKYHPNIGLDALRKRINDYLRMPEDTTEHTIEGAGLNGVDQPAEKGEGYTTREIAKGYIDISDIKLTDAQKRNEAINDARRLVRVLITCMDPNKRQWPGEIISVSNSVVGTHKKFIPFNTGVPYHIPNILYQELKDKKCQIFVNGRSHNGQTIKKAQSINAFAIEVLPALTDAEIKELKQRQAMAAGSQD